MIDVRNLGISFRKNDALEQIVHDVSFSIAAGSITGIVGESGAGKSMLALAIMGLLDPVHTLIAGNILFDGVDLTRLSRQELRAYQGNKMAMIFQEPMTSLNPVLTCGYQVGEAVRRHYGPGGYDNLQVRQQVIALFEEAGLPRAAELTDSYPHELSGGQKQRVMIAMALACNPSLLIADEPTTALDTTVQKRILDLLLEINRKRKMSMLFISHDLGVIGKMADELIVMRNGRVEESGPAARLLLDPKTHYTRGLIAARPVTGQKLQRLPELQDILGQEDLPGPGPAVSVIRSDETARHLTALYSAPPLIQVKDLRMEFPAQKGLFRKPGQPVNAVDGVSFDIFQGEIVGLVGESGSGKTTLGRCLLRLTEPTSGQVLYRGRDVLAFDKKTLREQRRRMQIMFQDPYSSLNPVMSVGEAIIEPMRYHGILGSDAERKEFAAGLLLKVGMKSDHLNRYPHEFSGGQRQRIGIARTLALQPEFIVCDETVSALDVSVQAQVLNLLKDLQEEFKLTYLFITHDLSVVYHLADKMIVMNRGKIEERGTPEQLFRSPETTYLRSLLDAIPAGADNR